MVGRIILQFLLGIASVVISHAALIAAHDSGWYPDQELARFIVASPELLHVDWFRWGLTALLAVLIFGLADYFLYRRYPRAILTAPIPPKPQSDDTIRSPAVTPYRPSAPAAIPTSILAPKPENPPRDFVDAHVSPEFLVGLYEGQTTLGAEKRAAKYIGKWLLVSGSLLETFGGYPLLEGKAPAVAAFASMLKRPSIIMVFHDEWIDRLATVAKNQNISVSGQIKEIGRDKIVLNHCELVERFSDDLPATPATSP
jgi:hypothetical protein